MSKRGRSSGEKGVTRRERLVYLASRIVGDVWAEEVVDSVLHTLPIEDRRVPRAVLNKALDVRRSELARAKCQGVYVERHTLPRSLTLQADLRRAIDSLAPLDKWIATKVFVEEWTCKEVSTVLHIPISTIGWRVQKVRSWLQEVLAHYNQKPKPKEGP